MGIFYHLSAKSAACEPPSSFFSIDDHGHTIRNDLRVLLHGRTFTVRYATTVEVNAMRDNVFDLKSFHDPCNLGSTS